MPSKYPSQVDRLLCNSASARCPKPELGDCWLWLGNVGNSGYGRLNVRTPSGLHVSMYAHRYALRVFCGVELPGEKRRSRKRTGMHLCNVKLCINPNHLRWGTQKENVRQTVAEGRHVSGFAVARARALEQAQLKLEGFTDGESEIFSKGKTRNTRAILHAKGNSEAV